MVVTGLWECGSSGGNRQIKTLIQRLAASLASTKLRFVCAGKEQEDVAVEFEELSKECLRHSLTVGYLLSILHDLRLEDDDARHLFRVIMAKSATGR